MGTETMLLTSILVLLVFLIYFGWKIKKQVGSEPREEHGQVSGEMVQDGAAAVDWIDELQEIRKEKEDETRNQEQHARRRQREDKELVARLDGMVTDLLSKMGTVQWGSGRYELVSGTAWGDSVWETRRRVEKDASEYRHADYYEAFSVRLCRQLGEFYFSSRGASEEEHTTARGDVSEEGLKEVLKHVMRSGPCKKREHEILSTDSSQGKAE